MRYPTLPTARLADITARLIAGEAMAVENHAIWEGTGESIDFAALDDICDSVRADLAEHLANGQISNDREPFEGRLAAEVFPYFDALPLETLDDPGFWRYLAADKFWWFIEWREADPISNGNVATYTDGNRNTEQIPLRLYLRAKSVGGDQHLAQAIPSSTDFWRSHVIRVRTGTAEPLARAFATSQVVDRMSTTVLRDYARRLNRMWTNVALGSYDDAAAQQLIEELRQ
jgi:hypothetical protein